MFAIERHKVLDFPVTEDFQAEQIQQTLDELGERNWKLIGQTRVNDGERDHLVYALTRESVCLPAESNGL